MLADTLERRTLTLPYVGTLDENVFEQQPCPSWARCSFGFWQQCLRH